MNVIDNAALSVNITDGINKLQSAGLALEDHLPGIVEAAVDAELAKVQAVIEQALAPVLARVDALNATVASALAEMAKWREMVSNFPIVWRA